MERQADGQMNWSDFIGALLQRWRFEHVFQKLKNNMFFKIIWLDCEPYRRNQYKKGIQRNTT